MNNDIDSSPVDVRNKPICIVYDDQAQVHAFAIEQEFSLLTQLSNACYVVWTWMNSIKYPSESHCSSLWFMRANFSTANYHQRKWIVLNWSESRGTKEISRRQLMNSCERKGEMTVGRWPFVQLHVNSGWSNSSRDRSTLEALGISLSDHLHTHIRLKTGKPSDIRWWSYKQWNERNEWHWIKWHE